MEGNIVSNFLVVEGICIEDAECNLREDIEILILFKNTMNFVNRGYRQENRVIHIGSRCVQALKCSN